MAIIQTWCPPSQEHWQSIGYLWKWFPIFTVLQWLLSYYPMGKTSIKSRFNLPGPIGWATMEAPGFVTLLYIMYSLPKEQGIESLPWPNWLMAGLFTVHYLYRALLCPLLLNPSMAPIHIDVWFFALCFQLINATNIGGWLGGFGPTTMEEWTGSAVRVEVGMIIFALGLFFNMYHDDELREIRRAAARSQKKRENAREEQREKKSVDRVYMIPQNGLFRVVLYPHYLCEWIEWCGFWVIGGWACTPARTFVINEVTTMLPRAIQGRRWYTERFGKEKIADRAAVIPGLL